MAESKDGAGAGSPNSEPERDPKTGQFLKKSEKSEKSEKSGEAGVAGAKTPPPSIFGSDLDEESPREGGVKIVRRGQKAKPIPNQAGATPAPGERTAPAAEPKPAASATPAKITVLGKEYESVSALEQMIKSLQGQFRSLQDARTQAEQMAERLNQTAAQWRQVAYQSGYSEGPDDPYASQFGGARQNQPAGQKPDAQSAAPGPDPASNGAADDNPLAGIDMNLYGDLVRSNGPHVAAYWLAQELGKKLSAKFEARIAEATKPSQELNARFSQARQMGSIVQQLAADKDSYPELSDPGKLQMITQLWSRLPWVEDKKMTPLGLHMSVLAYRNFASRQSPETQSGATPNSGLPPAPVAEGEPGAVPEIPGDSVSQQAAEAAAAAAAALESEGRDAGNDAIGTEGDDSPALPEHLRGNPEVAEIMKSFQVSDDDQMETLGFRRS